MSKVSRKEKQEEAIKRMKALGYYDYSIREFKKNNKDGSVENLMCSVMVNEPPIGAHYYVEDDLAERIKEFEDKNNAVVYMVIRSFTSIGKMDSFIFVSDYKEEWEIDWNNINEEPDAKYGRYFFSYTINYDMPDCSEFGSICAKYSIAGGYLRTA